MGPPARFAQDAGSVQNRPMDLTGLGSRLLRSRIRHGPGSVIGAGCQPAMPRAEATISIQALSVHLLDGPAADLQALGQFPLAHPPRPLLPDVIPLLLGQAGPSARETALGPRLGLSRDRAIPDRVPPPLAEGQHHLELELAGGRGRGRGRVSSARDRNSTPA